MNDPNLSATLHLNQQTVKLPVHLATVGYPTIEVSHLLKDKGVCTYDPGLQSTAICHSNITFIDGESSTLLHRGYPIEQLAQHCDFMDVSYLLLYGELPTSDQKQSFCHKISSHSQLQAPLTHITQAFARDAHPMAMLMSSIGSLSAQYPPIYQNNSEQYDHIALNLLAKVAAFSVLSYRHTHHLPNIDFTSEHSYAANFLNNMHRGNERYASIIKNKKLIKALDTIFILHADHEQNASTSTVRMVGSTGSHPIACLIAGLAALWGPSHGGANEACLNMLKVIAQDGNIHHYLRKAKDPQDPFRLMGFGHRVYKNYDPRAQVMQNVCHDVLAELGLQKHPLFALSKQLEKIALEDDYFIQRKLYPNIDFYSGIVLEALGIPSHLFTNIFAIARTAGWMAHLKEMLAGPYRLFRPRQCYTGAEQRDLPK